MRTFEVRDDKLYFDNDCWIKINELIGARHYTVHHEGDWGKTEVRSTLFLDFSSDAKNHVHGIMNTDMLDLEVLANILDDAAKGQYSKYPDVQQVVDYIMRAYEIGCLLWLVDFYAVRMNLNNSRNECLLRVAWDYAVESMDILSRDQWVSMRYGVG